MLDLDPWPEAESGQVKIHWPFEIQIRNTIEKYIIWNRKRKKHDGSK
jgi:hypothetical protein